MVILWPASRIPNSRADRFGVTVACVLIANNTLLAVFMGFVAWHIASYYPNNHWGFDARRGIIFCLINLAACVGILKRNRLTIALALCSLVLLVGLLLVDHFNILVEYNRWITRGMPGFGQWPRTLRDDYA